MNKGLKINKELKELLQCLSDEDETNVTAPQGVDLKFTLDVLLDDFAEKSKRYFYPEAYDYREYVELGWREYRDLKKFLDWHKPHDGEWKDIGGWETNHYIDTVMNYSTGGFEPDYLHDALCFIKTKQELYGGIYHLQYVYECEFLMLITLEKINQEVEDIAEIDYIRNNFRIKTIHQYIHSYGEKRSSNNFLF